MECRLLGWYEKNARKLPWRETLNPHHIWVSEIILQQTRVAQGLPFYYNFITNFPTIKSLAEAPEDAVLKVWQGLGYYSRARNMMKTAQIIMRKHQGQFPSNIAELRLLPGIGNYTAAAIGSFAFNIKMPAVDGNVRRVAARFFGLDDPIGTQKSDQLIESLLLDEMRDCPPALFNQAMIELGALVCKPTSPSCAECPLKENCIAFSKNLQEMLPVKIAKKAPKPIYMDYLFIESENHTWIEKRPDNGIWKGLYEFPNTISNGNKLQPNPFHEWFANSAETIMHEPRTFKHQLTHQTIFATLWQFSCKEANIVGEKLNNKIKISVSEIHQFPVHKLMYRFLTEVN
jgi:A/G-specific adenine glycosylase